MARRSEVQLGFEAISIEGGLFSADWLARVAQLKAGQQSDSDYGIEKGLNLRDEISRAWRVAQAHWSEFKVGLDQKGDALALTERFVLVLLRKCFQLESIVAAQPVELEGHSYPIGYQANGQRVPVVIASAGDGLDALSPRFGDEGRRRSAFGLAQEYLNAAEAALWGLCTDGRTLRLLRDNASLTRPAWVEADLAAIFTEERYADFAALWLLLHQSRFGRSEQPPQECALERWREAGKEEGTRAREGLRAGVEEALIALGQGFLSHPDNQALRRALEDGSLSTLGYYQQLLRLVYRLIFLLTAEERGLLHPEGSDEGARALYATGYGAKRLRERAARRSAHDRHIDLWEGCKIVFSALATGEPRLALPALLGLFDRDQCPALDSARLENHRILYAVFRLAWLRDETGLVRVNWRDMGPEELGSVYESLLELVPQVADAGRHFQFAGAAEQKGNARKSTGSYYTPDSLVQVLLDQALEPVVAATIAAHPTDAVDALLSLSVVDPACGSGHFLLAAARRLAVHVARLTERGTPSASEYRHALRQVIGRCLFGVDVNGLAVELCRVALWMEALEPGRPLSFLDAHIQEGNSLLGTSPELMKNGIPDEAWVAIEGDDKGIASALKKRNKAERAGQEELALGFGKASEGGTIGLVELVNTVERAPDEDVAGVARKEQGWQAVLASSAYRARRLAADAWCAAFVWKKERDLGALVPTDRVWRSLRDGPEAAPGALVDEVQRLTRAYGFFHWHLAFPQVFAKGGFDVVLGNPPWERVKLQEQEFFASRSEEIAHATNASVRKKLIAELPAKNPALHAEWAAASRVADGQSHFVRLSGRCPLCGKGDVNTYTLFAEHNRALLGARGCAGFIVPTGIATDDTTKEYFASVVETDQLAHFYAFENSNGLFPSVDRRYSFALICLATQRGDAENDLVFYARQVSDLADRERHFSLSARDLELMNPSTRTCPTFRTHTDAELTRKIYRNNAILGAIGSNAWQVDYLLKLIDPTIHRDFLISKPGGGGNNALLPLYEGKLLHQFDHRFSTFDNTGESRSVTTLEKQRPDFYIAPRYWLRPEVFRERLEGRPVYSRGFLSVRDIARATDERTLVTTVRPFVPALNSLGNLFCRSAFDALFLCGCLNSFAADYVTRQKVGGTHVSPFVLLQIAVVPTEAALRPASWLLATTSRQWIVERVLELTYTAWDLEPFARDVDCAGPPFLWDPERREALRVELDAAFFHLYGLSRDASAYIMDTFPIVKRHDEKAHGEYRTKRLILEVYDALAEATRSGTPYQTRLDPPPADPRVAHEASTRPEWAR